VCRKVVNINTWNEIELFFEFGKHRFILDIEDLANDGLYISELAIQFQLLAAWN